MRIDGIQVEDATKKLPLQVSAQNILDGKPNDPSNCAIANSCDRRAIVGDGVAYILDQKSTKEVWLRYIVSSKDAKLLRLVNDEELVSEPKIAELLARKIVLQPPPQSQKLGFKSGKSGSDKRSGQRKSREITLRNVAMRKRLNGN